METVETRELRYFVAVAEELHFGRAAVRLGIAQPPLSRAVQRLERRMGVQLLDRRNRTVGLTPAGQVLLDESRVALDAVGAAVRRAQRAGREERRLLVAMKPDGDVGLLPDILHSYRRDPESIEVEVLVCGIGEQEGMLRDGRVDVAFLPDPDRIIPGVDTERLIAVDHVAALPLGHPLAGRSAVLLADLDDDRFPRWPVVSPAAADRPEVRDVGQLMQLVALGQVIAVVPDTVLRRARSDVAYVPVLDAPPTALLLAWPDRTRSRAVAAFVRAAVEVAGKVAVDAAPTRVPGQLLPG